MYHLGMSDDYTLDDPTLRPAELTPRLQQAESGMEDLIEREKREKQRFHQTIAPPPSGSKTWDDLGAAFLSYIFDRLVVRPERIDEVLNEDAEIALVESLPKQVRNDLNELTEEVRNLADGKRDLEDLGNVDDLVDDSVVVDVFEYAEQHEDWPHLPGSFLEYRLRATPETLIRQGLPETLLDILESGPFTTHSVTAVSEVSVVTPDDVMRALPQMELSLHDFSRDPLTGDYGLHSCTKYFLAVAKHRPGTLVDDVPDVVNQLLTIGVDSETLELTRFLALCTVHEVIEKAAFGRQSIEPRDIDFSNAFQIRDGPPYHLLDTDRLEQYASGTSIAANHLLQEGNLSKLNVLLTCDIIVHGEIQNSDLIDSFDQPASIHETTVFLAVHRALAAVQSNRETALEAKALEGASLGEVIRQFGSADPVVRMHAANELSTSMLSNARSDILRQFADHHPGVRRILCERLAEADFSTFADDEVRHLVRSVVDVLSESVPEQYNLYAHLSLLLELFGDRPEICNQCLVKSETFSADWLREVLIWDPPADDALIITTRAFLANQIVFAYRNTEEEVPSDIESALFDLLALIVRKTSFDHPAKQEALAAIFRYVTFERQSPSLIEPLLKDIIEIVETDQQRVISMDGASAVAAQAQATRVLTTHALFTETQSIFRTVYDAYINVCQAYLYTRGTADAEVHQIIADSLTGLNGAMAMLTAAEGTDLPDGIADALKTLTEDSNTDIAASAVAAYSNLSDQDVADHLHDLQEDPDTPTAVRMAVSDALDDADHK